MLKLKLQYFGHLMQRATYLEKMRGRLLGKIEGKRSRRGQRMTWFDSITDSMDKFEQAPGDAASQGSLACCSPWVCKESDMTEQLTTNNNYIKDLVIRSFWAYGSLYPVTAFFIREKRVRFEA